jgi:hypothetical protein
MIGDLVLMAIIAMFVLIICTLLQRGQARRGRSSTSAYQIQQARRAAAPEPDIWPEVYDRPPAPQQDRLEPVTDHSREIEAHALQRMDDDERLGQIAYLTGRR